MRNDSVHKKLKYEKPQPLFTLGMPTQMFLTSKSAGRSVCADGAGTVVESLISRPWRTPV